MAAFSSGASRSAALGVVPRRPPRPAAHASVRTSAMFDGLSKSLQGAFSKVARTLSDTDDLSKARRPSSHPAPALLRCFWGIIQ